MTEEEKKEKEREYQHEYYIKNQEKKLERQRKRYAENREKVLERQREYRAANPEKDTTKNLFRNAKNRAKAKGLPFTLTKEWVVERIEWGKCELSGIPFNLEVGREVSGPFSPSIDKIVPELGYTPENCRVILCGINLLKMNGTDEGMFHIAEQLTQHKNSQEQFLDGAGI